MQFGLRLYDAMAGKRRSFWLNAAQAQTREPALRHPDLRDAMLYEDASTDDARLVLRVLLAAITDGGTALNYVAAAAIQRAGRVCGVRLHDAVAGPPRATGSTRVINAPAAGPDPPARAP